MKPRMTDSELDMFNTYVSKSKHYYEYGMGGSTVFVYNNTDTTTIEGIDSSKAWVDKVLSMCPDNTRLTARHVDIGTTGNWGYPCDTERESDWPVYSSSINLAVNIPDVVLVDGRFRVACMAMTVLHALKHGTDPTIILHDARRPHYTPGKKLLHLIDSSETLNIYKINTRDPDTVASLYDAYKYTTS